MNTRSITEAKDSALVGALPALKRSAARAKRIATQTGTRLVVAPSVQAQRTKTSANAKR